MGERPFYASPQVDDAGTRPGPAGQEMTMSPRGVAIPDVREHLFRAAERLLAREGPNGLTSRAITREAGVAKGLLYSHFSDLDEFLADFILDRFSRDAEGAATLAPKAGEGTVQANLADAALSLFSSGALALGGLVMSRPPVFARVHEALTAKALPFSDVEQVVTAYLDAEKKLGRVAAGADTDTLATALVGTVHHLFLTHRAEGPDLRDRVIRIAGALIAGMAPPRP
jgi:AcrR family transcriptional regulator